MANRQRRERFPVSKHQPASARSRFAEILALPDEKINLAEAALLIGFAVEGVGMPGHFIVRHRAAVETLYIDPFNGGRVLGEMGCAELVAEMSGGRRLLEPQHLLPVTKKQILMRMLSNLLGI